MKEWLKNAVFYEIYPQSYNDTNADGIGDFRGIIEKLDYIKDLGCTAIWMNPCFESPFTDAGYDISDFYKTAQRYGSNEDLKRLIDEVHKHDMHMILDLVPGHTSMECEWFKESKKPEKNKYSGRYVWTDSAWTAPQGGYGFLRGISQRNACCAVNFYSTQPALNYGYAKVTEPWQTGVDDEDAVSTREELLNILRFWLSMGCDGFRVDMANSLIKNDEGGAETIKLWQKIFSVINKEFPNAAFVSEWGDPSKSLVGGFDMDFLLPSGPSHYPDMYHCDKPYFSPDGTGDATAFFEYYKTCINKTYGKGFMCLPSGNHDTPRMTNCCDETQIKLVFAFMMSMPGVPFIYYGDEIGMKYLPNITSVEGGYVRTGSRTPMQWDSSLNCGFSTAKPERLYIMQDSDPNRPTVEAQQKNENSILNELKKQIRIRKENESLQESARFELISDGYPLVYKRLTTQETILVAINPMETERTIELEGVTLENILYEFNGAARVKNGKLIVPPSSASYIRIK